MFIGDLEDNIEDAAIKVLKYVDDSKIIINIECDEDVYVAQDSLDRVYEWANTNNMRWNKTKFQLLRLGPTKFRLWLYTMGAVY